LVIHGGCGEGVVGRGRIDLNDGDRRAAPPSVNAEDLCE